MIDLAQRDGTAVRELVAQIARFVLVGVVSTGATFVLYGVVRFVFSPVPATLLANAVTTVLAAELHRRITFSGATASGKRMAVQNFVSWAWSSGSTSIGLVVLGAVVAEPTYFQETTVMVVMSAVGGGVRFIALRWWVLVSRGRQDEVAAPVAVQAERGAERHSVVGEPNADRPTWTRNRPSGSVLARRAPTALALSQRAQPGAAGLLLRASA
jgi:putative flippase GtrA